jgi:hypothetical protein
LREELENDIHIGKSSDVKYSICEDYRECVTSEYDARDEGRSYELAVGSESNGRGGRREQRGGGGDGKNQE